MTQLDFAVEDQVIFKQREARHLAIRDLSWEYEDGHITWINKKTGIADVCWLQGHHSRNDRVPFEDIVAIYDESQPSVKIGLYSGPSRVLQEIVEEGT